MADQVQYPDEQPLRVVTWAQTNKFGHGTSRSVFLDGREWATIQIPEAYRGREEEYIRSRIPAGYLTPGQVTAIQQERSRKIAEQREAYRTQQAAAHRQEQADLLSQFQGLRASGELAQRQVSGIEAFKAAERANRPVGIVDFKTSERKAARDLLMSTPGQTYFLGTAQKGYTERPQRMDVKSYYLGNVANRYKEQPREVAPTLSFLSSVAPKTEAERKQYKTPISNRIPSPLPSSQQRLEEYIFSQPYMTNIDKILGEGEFSRLSKADKFGLLVTSGFAKPEIAASYFESKITGKPTDYQEQIYKYAMKDTKFVNILGTDFAVPKQRVIEDVGVGIFTIVAMGAAFKGAAYLASPVIKGSLGAGAKAFGFTEKTLGSLAARSTGVGTKTALQTSETLAGFGKDVIKLGARHPEAIIGGVVASAFVAEVARSQTKGEAAEKVIRAAATLPLMGVGYKGVTTKDITAAAREARIAGYQVRGTAKDAGVYLRKAIQTQRKGMKEFVKNEQAAMQMQLSRQGIIPRQYISAELASAAKSSYVSRVYSISEIVGLRAADIGRSFALSETSMMTALKSKIKNLEAKISDPNRPRQSKKNIEFEQKILQQWKKELKELQQVSSKQPDVTVKVGKITQKQISASIGATAKTELKSAVRQVQSNASKQFQANISAQIEKTNLQMSGIGLKQIKKPAIKTPSEFVKGAVARQKTIQKISRGALLGIMAGVGHAQRVSQAISPAQQYAGALKSVQATHSGSIQAIRSIQGQALGQVTTQIQVQKQAQLQRQIQRQVQKIRTKKPVRNPPEKKVKPPRIPNFDSQLEAIAKDRKKKGRFFWGINNAVPTLEALLGSEPTRKRKKSKRK